MPLAFEKVAGYLPDGLGGVAIVLPKGKGDKRGTFQIRKGNEPIGEVDICSHLGKTYVSVTLIDTFLSIKEMNDLIDQLKYDFDLPEEQKISIEQR